MVMIRSLSRGLQALALLADFPEGVSVGEMSSRLDVDKSTAMRLLKTLVDSGFAVQSQRTRRYHMTTRIVGLSHRFLKNLRLRELAYPFLEALVSETNESAHLAIAAGGEALVLDDIVTQASLRVETGAGRFSPLHCTAIGKALLAYSQLKIEGPFHRYTENTLTQQNELVTNLGDVRSRGYAVDNEEYMDGVRCLAAPVIDAHGICVGALGISGPANRVTLAAVPDLGATLLSKARALAEMLA